MAIHYQFHVVDQYGNVKAGAFVRVVDRDTQQIVTIYADKDGVSTKSNPFTADADGYASFWVDAGYYDVTAYTAGYSRTWTDINIGVGEQGPQGEQGFMAVNAAAILRRDEGIAVDCRAREYAVADYADVLTASGRPDSIITLARASAATYFDRDGLLKSASSNVLRYHYDPATREARGLLLEGAATNLLQRSEEFDNSYWAKTRASITSNAAVAPDGTTTADKAVEDSTATNSHQAWATNAPAVSELTQYTFSVFIKKGERTWARLRAGTNIGFVADAYFDVDSGAISGVGGTADSTAIEAYPNGWYRCSLTVTTQAGATSVNTLGAFLASGSGQATYSGDGTSGMYFWGAQLELGKVASSYIKTTTATVTRAADSVVIGPNTFPILSNGECTLYWRGRVRRLRSSGNVGWPLRAWDNTANEFMGFRESTAISGVDASVVDGGSTVGSTSAKTDIVDSDLAVAASVRANDLKFYANGAQASLDGALSLPTIDRLTITPSFGSVYEIDEIAYIARALSAAELATLTA